MTEIGLVHTASLFTRGPESVRIVRISQAAGRQRLVVEGPGDEILVHQLDDVMGCAQHEAELERRLVAKGFRLERFTAGNRRRGADRRAALRGPDRRRHLERVV